MKGNKKQKYQISNNKNILSCSKEDEHAQEGIRFDKESY